MTKKLLLLVCLLLLQSVLYAQMILVFDTNLSEGTTISLPLAAAVDVSVDWGDDGTTQNITTAGIHEHTYEAEGIYTVSINGTLGRFGIYMGDYYPGSDMLTEVTSFGNLGLTSLSGAFVKAGNLVKVPLSLPETVVNVSYMFYNAQKFNQDIGAWNVSNVRDMSGMFRYALPSTRTLEAGIPGMLQTCRICFMVPLHSTRISVTGKLVMYTR